ncbi:bifunctional folylpolyglutamate synthase/dihydrofolate synthase [Gudongella sp. SC589]|jgi:dihydrofolate synthase/folylpolyglutamate synthase|uniref:bifunctional folylpolyglutamate synthase/dihydrofolate synthase n=1 Tax=Gudongella sp. SC589 TaxID=3385990 RepID=UPI003904B3B9
MNYEEALAYINDKEKYGSRLGLDSIRTLLGHLGDPHIGMKYIHVGGTNGKGSTSAYLAHCLEEAGYRSGLYTSPYLERFTERIQINGEDIPQEVLGDITSKVKKAADRMVQDGMEHPTTFELVTAVGFEYFNRSNVDFVILEVGLGGRFDSTNVIQSSVASVITTIDYDHTDVLGKTLAEIAYQKAGIIKENGLVVSYPQKMEAEKVIAEVAYEKGADFVKLPIDNLKIRTSTYQGSVFDFKYKGNAYENLQISMLGDYQVMNAALAVTTILELRDRGILEITEGQLRSGLLKTKWKGRLEVLSRDPIFLIDGAHNLQGITLLADAVKMFPYNRLILGMSVLKDKDYTHMIEKLVPLADQVVVTEVNMPRKLAAELLGEEVRKLTSNVHVEKTIKGAVRKSIELAKKDDMILFGGSLYMIGEVRSHAINLLTK